MTKAQALADFKENVLPEIKKAECNGVDEPMRSQAWNDYTDALCKSRHITLKQYESWTNPF
jgi:hypothetical protein